MTSRHQEKGYTLFLTISIVLLFGVLSLSLLSITISGAQKSSVREDTTQATELAQKGVKQLTQQINHDVQEKINTYPGGVTKSHYVELLEETLVTYTCSGNETYIKGETGKYHTCVEDIGEPQVPREVKIKSLGKVDDREKMIMTKVLFGGDLEEDNREYAASTFIHKDCTENKANCLPGEGNMFLHGGVAIQGDISVERHLITSNRSYEKYAGHHWLHSYYPSALPKENGATPKIVVGGDVHTFYWDGVRQTNIPSRYNPINYAEHISQIDISSEKPYEKKEKIDETVFVGSYIAERCGRVDHPTTLDVNITSEKDKYYYTRNDPGVKIIETNLFGTGGVDRVIYNEQFPNDRVYPKWYRNYHGRFTIRGESTFKQFATSGDVRLGGVRLHNDIEFIDGAYVGGDLKIDNNTKVKGPIYVEGDVEITGRNLVIDSVIYVNGSVHIKHATLDATIDSNIKGSFIIYAEDDIYVERMNRFNDHPAELHAFLFSNRSIEIDGNETNVEIKGGISAPRIVLNSIRGRSYSGIRARQNEPQIVEGRSFDGWQDQRDRVSRLKIIYDEEIFEKYSNLLLESRITSVSPPKVIDIEE